MTGAGSTQILKTKSAPREIDLAQSMRWVRATHGRGMLRQLADIVALGYSRQRLQPKDYYFYGLFRPEFGPAERASYVSMGSSMALNLRLSPIHGFSQHSLMLNKALMGPFLASLGLPTSPILALHAADLAVPGLRPLRDAAAIAAFLGEGTALPCFGKPVFGSLAIGAVSILAAEDGGARLRLGDDRLVATSELAAEIVRYFPKGYIFQPLIRQHPEVAAYNGQAVGGLRVLTLRTRSGPEVLYTVLRMPPKGVMTDGVTGATNTIALIDPATGRALRGQDLGKLCTTPATVAPATGKPIAEIALPQFDEALGVCLAAHGAFPSHGVLGFDVAFSTEGPLINEINSRPMQHLYQRAADRGLLNPDFLPRIEEAIAMSRDYADALGVPRRRRAHAR